MRLAIGRANPVTAKVRPVKSLRQAVRLGGDVFHSGIISPATTRKAVKAFKKFSAQIKKSKAKHIRAVGTSALRDAKNGDQFVRRIERESGIRIEIISGLVEAKLIQEAVFAKIDYRRKSGLLIDIGGGSVEVSIIKNGLVKAANCSPMGTVRLLPFVVEENLQKFDRRLSRYSNKIEHLLRCHLSRLPPAICAGTGGNIEEIGKLRRKIFRKKDSNYITRSELMALTALLTSMTYRQRQSRLGLRPDRADVIIPAVLILGRILDLAHVAVCHIPGVGVKEGLLLEMLAEYNIGYRNGSNNR